MRLKSISIENFRCYGTATTFDFDQLTMVVGANDAGKSCLLEALAVFFGEHSLDKDDLTVGSTDTEIRITCVFDDLPAVVVLDSHAETTLAGEHLLDSGGLLTVRKTFKGGLQTPKASGVYAVALHPSAEQYDDLLSLNNTQLKKRAKDLGVPVAGVNQTKNPELRAAIWGHCPALTATERPVPLDEKGSNNVWKNLELYLPAFALFKSDRQSTDQDSEAQDPLKTAIKQALLSKQAELDALSAHVEQEVKKVADATLAKLQEMDSTLAAQLNPTFNTPSWHTAFKVALTDDTQVPINKRGSGVRRLILLNFFRAKAEQDAGQADRPGTIYAIEEPETSQHPANQLLLLSAFQDIASQVGNQVLLTSHTPVLARRLDVQHLRYIEVDATGKRTVHGPGVATNQMISNALGVLADHDVKVFVGVEGKHDIEFLCRISAMLVSHGEAVPDLRAEETAGRLCFVPLGGSNLALWVDRLTNLNRPEVHVFDRDAEPPAPAKYQAVASAINAKPNAEALITCHREMENYVAEAAMRLARPDLPALPTLTAFSDVPALIAEAFHTASGCPTPWASLDDQKKKKKESKQKVWLNRAAVDHMTPAMLATTDPNDDVRSWLQRIGQHL